MNNPDSRRDKSPEHREKIRASMRGNQNAKQHGLYSRTPPALTCNNCYSKETCPEYKPRSVCSITETFKGLPRDTTDCVEKLKEIISVQEQRTFRNIYFEQLDGGKAIKENSSLIKQLIECHALILRLYQELQSSQDTITLDGDDVLSKIFGP